MNSIQQGLVDKRTLLDRLGYTVIVLSGDCLLK